MCLSISILWGLSRGWSAGLGPTLPGRSRAHDETGTANQGSKDPHGSSQTRRQGTELSSFSLRSLMLTDRSTAFRCSVCRFRNRSPGTRSEVRTDVVGIWPGASGAEHRADLWQGTSADVGLLAITIGTTVRLGPPSGFPVVQGFSGLSRVCLRWQLQPFTIENSLCRLRRYAQFPKAQLWRARAQTQKSFTYS